MGPGELQAMALALAKGVPLLLSDDREAQIEVEKNSDIVVLRLNEVIALGEFRGAYTRAEAVDLYYRVNSVQKYPVSGFPADIVAEGMRRLHQVGKRSHHSGV